MRCSLRGYARCLRSVQDKWLHELEWMAELRVHLRQLMEEKRRLRDILGTIKKLIYTHILMDIR